MYTNNTNNDSNNNNNNNDNNNNEVLGLAVHGRLLQGLAGRARCVHDIKIYKTMT